MKIDLLALYQKTLLGGLGGLCGWLLITMFAGISTASTFLLYLRVALTGGLIGIAIGAACGGWEGLFRDRSPRRLARGAGIGAGIGLVGGAIGLVIGEVIFGLAGGGLFPRAIGWGIFGAMIGTNEGVSKRMPQKMRFGAFGGLLGGLIGGSTYEFLATGLQGIGLGRDTSIAVGGAVGLVLLGMFIGLLIGLVEDLLRAAWLLFTTGRFEGQTRTLDPAKAETTIGRSESADICILGDPNMATNHARLVPGGGGFVLEAVEGEVQVNQQPVRQHQLTDGELIQIGSSRARFHLGGSKS